MREELIEYLKSVVEARAVVEWDAWWKEHDAEVRRLLPVGWYCRLQQKGARGVLEVLEELGVSYEIPEPEWDEPKPVGEGCCQLCGGAITGQRRCLHARHADGERVWCTWNYRGTCRACDLDFQVTLGSGEPAIWGLVAPEPDWLWEPVTPQELAELNRNPPDPVLGCESWVTFVARAHPEDVFWTYRVPERWPGIARVRKEIPVARFGIFSQEFWESWEARER